MCISYQWWSHRPHANESAEPSHHLPGMTLPDACSNPGGAAAATRSLQPNLWTVFILGPSERLLEVFGGFQLDKREPEVAGTLGGPVRSWSDDRGVCREYRVSSGRIAIGCETDQELGRSAPCNDIIHAYPDETSPETLLHTAVNQALEALLTDKPRARVMIHLPEPSRARQASILVEERKVRRLSLIRFTIPSVVQRNN